ncbi:MAG: hypothetical protein F6J86_33160 [Symploca sp. SIO1B1]|nr:hypothetical protein [Symploca sp. SIO1B1]
MAEIIDMTDFQAIDTNENVQAMHGTMPCTVSTECLPVPMHSDECLLEVPTSSGENTTYTVQEMLSKVGLAKRTFYKYVKHIIETWYWLPETAFRVNGQYTELALQEALKLKETTFPAYQETVQDEHAEAVQQDSQLEVTGGLALITQEDSPFAGLAVRTKASDRVQVLQGELELISSSVDEDFGDFLAITAELEAEDSAWTQQDELEWQTLRKQNAQKWLKRRAILERDKQQILQGDVPLAKKS